MLATYSMLASLSCVEEKARKKYALSKAGERQLRIRKNNEYALFLEFRIHN
jgi:hypothetical protein